MSTFTWVHTALSVAALIAGLIVVIGLFSSKTLGGWTAIFLATAIATSATGFGFPFQSFGASHWIGVISLVILGLLVSGIATYLMLQNSLLGRIDDHRHHGPVGPPGPGHARRGPELGFVAGRVGAGRLVTQARRRRATILPPP